MKKIFILSLLSSISFIGCSVFNNNYGYMSMSVKFPHKFNVKAIPENTSLINVEVKGEGLTNSIVFDLTKSNNRKFLEKIAIGNKYINAIAKDDKGIILAKGSNSIYVLAGRTNLVEIILNPVSTPLPPSNQTPLQSGETISDSNNQSSDSTNTDNTSDSNSEDSSDTTDLNNTDDSSNSEDSTNSDSSDSSFEGSYGDWSGGVPLYDPDSDASANITLNIIDGSPIPSSSVMSIETPRTIPSPTLTPIISISLSPSPTPSVF